jgi:hypothetical protein
MQDVKVVYYTFWRTNFNYEKNQISHMKWEEEDENKSSIHWRNLGELFEFVIM